MGGELVYLLIFMVLGNFFCFLQVATLILFLTSSYSNLSSIFANVSSENIFKFFKPLPPFNSYKIFTLKIIPVFSTSWILVI